MGGLEVVAAGEDGEEAGRVLGGLGGGVERAVVGQHVGAQGKDLAVLGRRDFALHDVVPGERGRHQVLGAVLHPLDRAAGDDRADDGEDVARIDPDLVAEAAADIGGDDPDLVLGDAGDDREQGPVCVRGLGGFVEGQFAVDGVEVGDGAAGLHRCGVDARVHHLLADHDVGGGEHRVGLGLVAHLPVEDPVVRPALDLVADHRRVRVQRLAGVHQRGKDIVFDVDQLQGVPGGVTVFGHDERDLLPLEPDLVGDQDGLDIRGERRRPREVQAQQVLAGDDRDHFRMRQGVGGVDGHEPGVRHRSPQDGAVQHSRQHDVVHVVALAAHEARVFLALDAAITDRPVLVACGRVRRPLMDDGHAFTSVSSVLVATVSVATSSTAVSVPSRTSSVAGASSRPLPAGWAAAHCTERTIVA